VRYTFVTFDTYIPDIYIYMSKNLRICGYFSKPKWVREQKKKLRNTALYISYVLADIQETRFSREKLSKAMVSSPHNESLYGI
jgi:hypothetical protein